MQSARGRGRSATRGGGLSYKCRDSSRGAALVRGFTDIHRQAMKRSDSDSVERCTDSDSVVVGRCTLF